MGLKLTTRDSENFGLLILKVADGTAGSLADELSLTL